MWDFLSKLVSNGILKVIIPLCSTIKCVFSYLNKKEDIKKEKEIKENEKEECKTIDDICNKGTIEDLINLGDKMKNSFLLLIGLLSLNGCINTSPVVQTTNSWEQHYMTTNDFYKGTQNIQLKKGETIWVLSNTTLSKILKDLRKN